MLDHVLGQLLAPSLAQASSWRICSSVLARVPGTERLTKKKKAHRTAAKGRKTALLRTLASGRKAWPTTKLASQLVPAESAAPLAQLSAAKSSAGKSHGTGPIPIPKLMTKPTTDATASGGVQACPGSLSARVSASSETTMPTVEASSRKRRPDRSISSTDRTVMPTLPMFINTAMSATVEAAMPLLVRKMVEKLKMLLIPLNCCAMAHTTQIRRALRVFGWTSMVPMPLPPPRGPDATPKLICIMSSSWMTARLSTLSPRKWASTCCACIASASVRLASQRGLSTTRS
mmetsp:Transcript_37654/g.120998  ORF Transcript_37654/g.120998 Transcript_37654/m.120998 type:complete len:289 (-) Transcript_37654:951-1817(-)